MQHPDSYPHYWINHLGFVIRKTLVKDFAAHGHKITAEEWAILLQLANTPGMTTTALSDRTFRDKTTSTRMIDKLVAKALVERHPDPEDRRRIHLLLTDAGRILFGELSDITRDLITRSVEGVALDDLAATTRTLAKITGNLTAQPPKEGDV